MPSAWWTISAWRRDTVASSKRTSAARERPIRVHSRCTGTTCWRPASSKARYLPGTVSPSRASATQAGWAASGSGAGSAFAGMPAPDGAASRCFEIAGQTWIHGQFSFSSGARRSRRSSQPSPPTNIGRAVDAPAEALKGVFTQASKFGKPCLRQRLARTLRRVRSRAFEIEAALLRASVDALAAVRPSAGTATARPWSASASTSTRAATARTSSASCAARCAPPRRTARSSCARRSRAPRCRCSTAPDAGW